MKILLIAYYFPPTNVIGALRTGKLARFLMERGHDVRVLTASDPSLPQELAVEVPQESIVTTGSIDLARIGRQVEGGAGAPRRKKHFQGRALRILRSMTRSILAIPDAQAGWYPFAMKAARRLETEWRPDVIYASAVPFTALFLAARLSRRWSVPWVAELRDLWADTHHRVHPLWRHKIDQALERRVLRTASHLVTVSDPLAKTLGQAHPDRPVTVIRNGIDPADIARAQAEATPATEGPLRLIYTGIVYENYQNPAPLFAALAAMPAEERAGYRVEFYGHRLASVTDMASEAGLDGIVTVHAPVPHAEALRLQAEADVLLLLLWEDPDTAAGVVTGKVFEYLGAARPILALGRHLRQDPAQMVATSGGGRVETHPDDIAKALRGWRDEKGRLGRPAPSALPPEIDLTRESQFERIWDILDALKLPQTPEETSKP